MTVIRRASTTGRGDVNSRGSAGATSSLSASEFMSAMLTYLTPIVRAGKPIVFIMTAARNPFSGVPRRALGAQAPGVKGQKQRSPERGGVPAGEWHGRYRALSRPRRFHLARRQARPLARR